MGTSLKTRKPRGPAPGTGGRPKADIDWDTLDRLAEIACPCEDIAEVVRVSANTICETIKKKFGITFREYAAQKRGRGRAALRNMQLASARSGNVTMQIWLGKQWLNQTDRVEKIDKAWADKLSQKDLLKAAEQAMAVLKKEAET